MIAFGPIPSRRLGQSLGINNIPPKVCTYNCVYCQAGLTTEKVMERRAFFDPRAIVAEVVERVARLRAAGERIDYLSFVPDGEPTLDVNLGKAIAALRALGIPIAVITNGSLLWRHDVRRDLARADWVCVKIDAATERAWMRLDRPFGRLGLQRVLSGVRAFAAEFRGVLVTETMLVRGMNDHESAVAAVAELLGEIEPSRAYILAPVRPPAERGTRPPHESAIARAYAIFRERVPDVECLLGYEAAPFGATGCFERDVLGAVAVHPMREDSVRELVGRESGDWEVVEGLVRDGQLVRTSYAGTTFFTLPMRG